MSKFPFLRASVTPCETSPVSSLLRMSTKRRAAGVSLFVDRREAGPLSCRTAGARSCRRGRENPKGGEDAEAMPGENEVFSPGGASVASTAPCAVSRRRRFVFARSAETLHDVSATLNTCAEETQSVSEGRSQSDSERSELPARAREGLEEGRHGERKEECRADREGSDAANALFSASPKLRNLRVKRRRQSCFVAPRSGSVFKTKSDSNR